MTHVYTSTPHPNTARPSRQRCRLSASRLDKCVPRWCYARQPLLQLGLVVFAASSAPNKAKHFASFRKSKIFQGQGHGARCQLYIGQFTGDGDEIHPSALSDRGHPLDASASARMCARSYTVSNEIYALATGTATTFFSGASLKKTFRRDSYRGHTATVLQRSTWAGTCGTARHTYNATPMTIYTNDLRRVIFFTLYTVHASSIAPVPRPRGTLAAPPFTHTYCYWTAPSLIITDDDHHQLARAAGRARSTKERQLGLYPPPF